MLKSLKGNCKSNPLEKGMHTLDIEKIAIDSISSFFANKKWFVGGKIPHCELYSNSSVKTVLRGKFDDTTFDFIHNECLTRIPKPKDFKVTKIHWTVTFLLKLLNEMKQLGLPKDFQPGLLLLYFKFCKGIRVPSAF